MFRVSLNKFIQRIEIAIQPNVGLRKVFQNGFDMQRQASGSGIVGIKILRTRIGKQFSHKITPRRHIPGTSEIRPRHNVRLFAHPRRFGFDGIVTLVHIGKYTVGHLLFIVKCSNKFYPFGPRQQRSFHPLVVENHRYLGLRNALCIRIVLIVTTHHHGIGLELQRFFHIDIKCIA